MDSRLITVAIHTCDHAQAMRRLLEREGIEVTLQNVNLESPVVSSGIRVRIHEADLPLALRIIENVEAFSPRKDSPADGGNEILIPVDFSEYSFNALCTGARMAFNHNMAVRILHSYIEPLDTPGAQLSDALTFDLTDNNAREQVRRTAETAMKNLVERFRSLVKAGQAPSVPIHTTIVEGVPEDAIVEYAREESPFMLVMGTRSYQRKERELIGSVTAQVIDDCRRTVFAIPENVESFNPAEITEVLFLTELDQSDILVMDSLFRVFPRMAPKVTVAYLPQKRKLYGNQTKAVDSLIDYFRQHIPDATFEKADINVLTAASDVERLRHIHNYQLMVVPNKRKSSLRRFFNPGLAHKIIFRADIPMLIITV
ncbi:MAG: universal stress protein [Muribaculaceae bacterium]|nr:universal stress protein [Muribaculaceae bacterium]